MPITIWAMYSEKIAYPSLCFVTGNRDDEQSDGASIHCTVRGTYLVVIVRHLGDIAGARGLAPPGKDEWTSDDKVDEPVRPPPPTTAKQRTSLSSRSRVSVRVG